MKTSRTEGQPAKTPVSIRSEGQRLLIERGGSLEDIALATGCSRQAALFWRSGAKVPSDATRERLREAFDIPVTAWGVKPGGKPPVAARESAPPSGTPTSLEDCLALHRVIRRARNGENLTTAERVRLADTEARVLAIRQRLENEAQLLEDRFVRDHPAWQRLRAVIIKVSAGCQRCSKLMLDELTRLDM